MRSTVRVEHPVQTSAHQREIVVADAEPGRYRLLRVQLPAHRRQRVRLLRLAAGVVEAAAAVAEGLRLLARQALPEPEFAVAAALLQRVVLLPQRQVVVAVEADAALPTRSNSSALSWIPAPKWPTNIASTRSLRRLTLRLAERC